MCVFMCRASAVNMCTCNRQLFRFLFFRVPFCEYVKNYQVPVSFLRILKVIVLASMVDYVWPEVWTKIGKAAQNREKQEWAKEKLKLDNARKLRGISSSIQMTKSFQKISKKQTQEKTGKTDGSTHALQARQTSV